MARHPTDRFRGHQLLPNGVAKKIPQLYATDGVKDKKIYVKFFTNFGSAKWLIAEYDGNDTMFGWVDLGQGGEWGYISLRELYSIKNRFGMPGVERDIYGSYPQPFSSAKNASDNSDLRKKVIRLAHSNPKLREHLLPLVTKSATDTAGDDYPYKTAEDLYYGLGDYGGASAFIVPLIFHWVGLPPITGGWSEIKKREDEAYSALEDFKSGIDRKMRKNWKKVQLITENPSQYAGHKDDYWDGVDPNQWSKAFAKHLR